MAHDPSDEVPASSEHPKSDSSANAQYVAPEWWQKGLYAEIIQNITNLPTTASDNGPASLLYRVATDEAVSEELARAELLKHSVAEADHPHVANRPEKITRFRSYLRAIRKANRAHPPGWGGLIASILIPIVLPLSGLFGRSTPPAPPPKPVPASARRESGYSLIEPDPEVVRNIASQLSPQFLQGLAPEQRLEVASTVYLELNELFGSQPLSVTVPPTHISSVMDSPLPKIAVEWPEWRPYDQDDR